ncbi:acetyltransferase [Corynebacterium sp.]|jgi:putative acetyltransferase|uniref:acetyltransferase n=1 Tax=Corynebacterium sp. TaxID=1720 RepID=UPI0025C103FF|nr:acetyltransferase [Corynebacterium sp.]
MTDVTGATGTGRAELRECRGPGEYSRLVEIWRSAVDATHDFLAEADRDSIEEALPGDYFPQVRLTVADVDGRPVGFAGTADGNLEMLFVHAEARGKGVGTLLLHDAVEKQGVSRVDVNEQNRQAVDFYLRRGFAVTSRDELDEAGRPYPVLHMAR